MADKLFRTYYNEKTESGTLPANSKILIQEGTDEPKKIDVDLFATAAQGNTADSASQATGVENNADVTDTINVTASGALMDSEVTNLSQVKAFDETDYATAAQGVLADNSVQLRTNKVVSASTYTILVTDVNEYLEFSGECVVTLPLSLAANLEFQGEQTGTGEVSFVSAATGTLNKFADFDNKTAGQFAPFGIRTKGSNVATLIGTLKVG